MSGIYFDDQPLVIISFGYRLNSKGNVIDLNSFRSFFL